jgi:hypothetical protein
MKLATKNILIASAIALVLPSVVSAATMSVSPASQSVKVGETFTVAIKLDTQGASIDGVDIRYLSFNPALLQVQDANPNLSGSQITPESLMAVTAANSVDNVQGRILFSQVAALGSKYKGSGNLAVVQFRAMAPGNAALTFGYTPKNTTDTNVAAAGTDVLTAVINGSYTIATGASTAPGRVNNTTQKPTPTPNANTNTNNNTNNTQNVNGDSNNQGTPSNGDGTAFQFKEKKSFFQTIWSLIVEAFISLKNRILHIFGK